MSLAWSSVKDCIEATDSSNFGSRNDEYSERIASDFRKRYESCLLSFHTSGNCDDYDDCFLFLADDISSSISSSSEVGMIRFFSLKLHAEILESCCRYREALKYYIDAWSWSFTDAGSIATTNSRVGGCQESVEAHHVTLLFRICK
jgi:hypothetical protein